MRIPRFDGDHGYHVYLNGREMKRVLMADDMTGEVRCARVNDAGRVFLIGDEMATETLVGEVRIEPMDGKQRSEIMDMEQEEIRRIEFWITHQNSTGEAGNLPRHWAFRWTGANPPCPPFYSPEWRNTQDEAIAYLKEREALALAKSKARVQITDELVKAIPYAKGPPALNMRAVASASGAVGLAIGGRAPMVAYHIGESVSHLEMAAYVNARNHDLRRQMNGTSLPTEYVARLTALAAGDTGQSSAQEPAPLIVTCSGPNGWKRYLAFRHDKRLPLCPAPLWHSSEAGALAYLSEREAKHGISYAPIEWSEVASLRDQLAAMTKRAEEAEHGRAAWMTKHDELAQILGSERQRACQGIQRLHRGAGQPARHRRSAHRGGYQADGRERSACGDAGAA